VLFAVIQMYPAPPRLFPVVPWIFHLPLKSESAVVETLKGAACKHTCLVVLPVSGIYINYNRTSSKVVIDLGRVIRSYRSVHIRSWEHLVEGVAAALPRTLLLKA